MKKTSKHANSVVWAIRAVHVLYPKNRTLRKIFFGQDKEFINKDFRDNHQERYHSVWRGWLRMSKAAHLDW